MFFFPTRSIREAGARQRQARCSAQTGRCKLVCASCSTQVALCKLLCASCSAQVAPASWSLQVAPCKLLCANCAPCKLLCASCSVQVALCKLLCVSCSAQVALGKALCANWSVQVGLRKLLCASCFKMQVASCDARPRTREESNSRPAGSGSRRANRDNSRGPVRTTKVAKTSSFCTSTTPIPAEGCASTVEIAKNHGFLHLDHTDPRRGLREHRRNRKKPRVFAPRPRRSPQRVAREL